MYETLDSRLAKSFGIDNDLCFPHRSWSFLSLSVVSVIDLLEVHRHFSRARLGLCFTVGVLVVTTMVRLYFARIKIHALAQAGDSAHQLDSLRSVSRSMAMLTGAALWACMAAMFFLT